MKEEDDILDVTPPAGIPGVLFTAMWSHVYERYPMSKRKAMNVTVELLEILTAHYEEVAKQESRE